LFSKYVRDAVALASRQGAHLFALRAALELFRPNPNAPGIRELLGKIHDDFPASPTAPLLIEAARILGRR
jgi:hypothetical protein